MGTKLKRWQRIALAGALPAAVIAVCVLLYTGLWNFPCLFFKLTGLYCPGCGTGRALKAFVHGRFGEAFRYNSMLFILGVPFLGIFFHEYLRMVFPKTGLRPVYIEQKAGITVFIVIILYWVLRNIPVFSFLAP
ncbi:MAG: DUF2752 domain-containing protein [Lachnospiraceae bacterium]|nr:DUF2752 domain-containing protein [Lachnospiraceae bacterium]